jgi:hypothetical protein
MITRQVIPRPVRAGPAGRAHEPRSVGNHIVPEDPAGVICLRVVEQPIGNGAIHVEEAIVFRQRMVRVVPHQHGRVPAPCRCIRRVEILKEIAADDPMIRDM